MDTVNIISSLFSEADLNIGEKIVWTKKDIIRKIVVIAIFWKLKFVRKTILLFMNMKVILNKLKYLKKIAKKLKQ
ncbi:MAG: hypothetical protein ACC612_01570 [Methanomethylovorans sp.]|uniref:hypothetical protein n=1 Tax=Methanomethylovorans sp. TaxID=2758717 RepID=UPI0035308833